MVYSFGTSSSVPSGKISDICRHKPKHSNELVQKRSLLFLYKMAALPHLSVLEVSYRSKEEDCKLVIRL